MDGRRPVRVINRTRGAVLGERVELALHWWGRLRGLMFRRRLAPGGGLWLEPCRQVHTFWMRFPIDVVYVGSSGQVVRVTEGMRPWRAGPWVREARAVLELPAGTVAATGTRVGDLLAVE